MKIFAIKHSEANSLSYFLIPLGYQPVYIISDRIEDVPIYIIYVNLPGEIEMLIRLRFQLLTIPEQLLNQVDVAWVVNNI